MGTTTKFDLDRAIVRLVADGAIKVPPYPVVALQVEKAVRGGDFGLDQLAKLISSDQVLAAEVLRVSNSAAYARGTPVNSVTAAVGVIGAKEVARLALAIGLGGHANAPGRLASLRRKTWRDALAGAALCQLLAPGRGLAPDEAFSAGLLHDFGKVLCIAAIEQLLERIEVEPRTEEAWAETVDRYHVELGVLMAARWALPPVVSDVIALHHSDQVAGAANREIIDLVVAVDEVTMMLGDRPHLLPEELGAAAFLRGDEGEKVSEALRQIPAFVASFEAGDVGKRGGASTLVAAVRPARHLAAGRAAPAWAVTLSISGKSLLCTLLDMAPNHLVVSAPSTVPENQLLKLKVEGEPPLACFATVKQEWPEAGSFSMLVQPYALPREGQALWRKLLVVASGRG
jgi:HD-like signal output (HDOD) protein